jgi:hypothetical protein
MSLSVFQVKDVRVFAFQLLLLSTPGEKDFVELNRVLLALKFNVFAVNIQFFEFTLQYFYVCSLEKAVFYIVYLIFLER